MHEVLMNELMKERSMNLLLRIYSVIFIYSSKIIDYFHWQTTNELLDTTNSFSHQQRIRVRISICKQMRTSGVRKTIFALNMERNNIDWLVFVVFDTKNAY